MPRTKKAEMTRAELLAVAKPALFNTEMVKAIQDNRKTVTRRPVKPQPACNAEIVPSPSPWYGWENDTDMWHIKPPYRPGDILYVRETWALVHDESGRESVRWRYKADDETSPIERWYPSIHMPKEAARIFLRVTGVKIQRVQGITDEEARREGCKDLDDFHRVWNDCYEKPKPVKVKGVIHHYESYPFEEIRETRTYKSKPWYVIGNPWIWGDEFERVEAGK